LLGVLIDVVPNVFEKLISVNFLTALKCPKELIHVDELCRSKRWGFVPIHKFDCVADDGRVWRNRMAPHKYG
jgi:hypothetical protein